MRFLPIVDRELRVASRRRNTYLGRIVSAVVAALIVGWELITFGSQPSMRSQMGQVLFGSLSVFVFVYCLLAGVRSTADCLAEEKREGTLGLLFLTDLRGYDVILGKLAASSLTTFYNLLAVFPVMAIPVLLGGVTGQMLVRTSVLMLNTMLFSLALGMLVSALSRNGRRAIGGAFLLVVFFVGGLPLLGVWWHAEFRPGSENIPIAFTIASPAYAFSEIDRTSGGFWWSIGVTHALAWVALIAASWQLPRSWQDKTTTARSAEIERRAVALAFGDTQQQGIFRRELLDRNPVLWLAARNRMDSLLLWGFLAAGAVVWFYCAWRWPREWFTEPVYISTALVLHLVLKAWLAGQACRQFAEDRRTGALELLLATSLPVKEIIHGQLLALRRVFSGPFGVALLVDLAFAIVCAAQIGTGDGQPYRSRESVTFFWTFVGGMASLLADAYTIAWLGMWLGLTSRNSGQASSGVMWRVIFLPSVVAWLLFSFIGIATWFGRWRFLGEAMLVAWFIIGFINDFFWVKFARTKLEGELREAATRRFETGQMNWFTRLFRREQRENSPTEVA